MSEFFADYGLFLLKSITVVVSVLIIIGAAVAASLKTRRRDEEGIIKVKPLHEEYRRIREVMQESILEKAALKKVLKQRKDERKAKKDQQQDESSARPRTYVIDFQGDVRVSKGERLANEVTAVLSIAEPEDEVVVRLESPGGLVHAYGLAASQLDRIRQRNIALTIAVDKVAASGGYMMACLGNKIIAAPFAVLGSIGVVAQIPNFHRLLKKNDVDVDVLTAGEFKRTLTFFGENTEAGRAKFLEDLEDTHQLFKTYVSEHRPQVDIEKVSTGEHWFGTRAKGLNLVDELMTSDEYLMAKSEHADIFMVEYELKKPLMERLSLGVQSSINSVTQKVLDVLWQRSQPPQL